MADISKAATKCAKWISGSGMLEAIGDLLQQIKPAQTQTDKGSAGESAGVRYD